MRELSIGGCATEPCTRTEETVAKHRGELKTSRALCTAQYSSTVRQLLKPEPAPRARSWSLSGALEVVGATQRPMNYWYRHNVLALEFAANY